MVSELLKHIFYDVVSELLKHFSNIIIAYHENKKKVIDTWISNRNL